MADRPPPSADDGVFRWARAKTRDRLNKFLLGGVVLGIALNVADFVLPALATPTQSQKFWNGTAILFAGIGAVVVFGYLGSLALAPYEQRNTLRAQVTKAAVVDEGKPFNCVLLRGWETSPSATLVITCRRESTRLRAAVDVPDYGQSNVPFYWSAPMEGVYEKELFKGQKQELPLGGFQSGSIDRIVDQDLPASVILMGADHEPQTELIWVRSAPLGMFQVRRGDDEWPPRSDSWPKDVLEVLNRVNAVQSTVRRAESADQIRQPIDGLTAYLNNSPIVGKSFTSKARAVILAVANDPFPEAQTAALTVVDGWIAELRNAARGKT